MPKLRCSYNLSSLPLLYFLYAFLYMITCFIQQIYTNHWMNSSNIPRNDVPSNPAYGFQLAPLWPKSFFSVKCLKCENDVGGRCSYKMMLRAPTAYLCVNSYCVTYLEPDLLQRRRRVPGVHCSQNCTWILPQDKLFSVEKWTNV